MILEKGLATFFEVGSALLLIREQRLHRATHANFEAYCRERWGIGRSYACRMIGAAERLKLLPPAADMPKPANEFQMRPFLKLEPAAFPKIWEEVTRRASDGEVTSSLIQLVIEELSTPVKGLSVGHKSRHRNGFTGARLGQLLAYLNDAKRKVERGADEEALAALERLETLLLKI